MIVQRQVDVRRGRRVAIGILGGLVLLSELPAEASAQETVTSLQGIVRNESGRPVEQAQVFLDPGASQRAMRTDAEGRFRFIGVPAGNHRLRVQRIGFEPRDTTVATAGPIVEIDIRLQRLTSLSEVAVRTRPTGVYGTVLERDSLKPVAGARIELLGGRTRDTTDAAGSFSMGLAPTGTFMLRVSREGYDTRLISVRVPRDSGVGIDIVLRPGLSSLDNRTEMALVDLAQRIHWKGVNSAVVGREELEGRWSNLEQALRFAPSYAKRTLVIDERACIFVDGEPRPNMTIKHFDLEDVESIEVFGSRSDISNTLAKRWIRGAICGNPATPLSPGNRAVFVSIWTRR